MDLAEFKGDELVEEIYMKAGEFAVVCFEGERNKHIEISAWEINKEKFDIFLVKPTDIMNDRFRGEQARLAKLSCSDFEETYTFDRKDRLCLVVSNMNATVRNKIVKIRLSWVIHGVDHSPFIAPKHKIPSQKRKMQMKNVLGICTLLLIPLFIGSITYLAIDDPVVVGIALGLTTLIVGIFRDEIRDRIGLSST